MSFQLISQQPHSVIHHVMGCGCGMLMGPLIITPLIVRVRGVQLKGMVIMIITSFNYSAISF